MDAALYWAHTSIEIVPDNRILCLIAYPIVYIVYAAMMMMTRMRGMMGKTMMIGKGVIRG